MGETVHSLGDVAVLINLNIWPRHSHASVSLLLYGEGVFQFQCAFGVFADAVAVADGVSFGYLKEAHGVACGVELDGDGCGFANGVVHLNHHLLADGVADLMPLAGLRQAYCFSAAPATRQAQDTQRDKDKL